MKRKPRIGVAGFQHETNTFAPVPAGRAAFEEPDAWPGLLLGGELEPALAGLNIPAAGFLGEARGLGLEPVALAWCSANPSGPVTREAYEHLAGLICEQAAAAGPLDGLYLDLHGAMVAEHLEDGEGELLERLRARLGAEVPIVASLDLHANVSARMVEQATALVTYRSYPHVDMAETGARAARLLARILAQGAPAAARRALPFLIPLTWQETAREPSASLLAEARRLEDEEELWTCSLAMGFPAADCRDCGPCVLAYAGNPGTARDAADRLAAHWLAREHDYAGSYHTPAEALERARARLAAGETRPLVLADTQDNPGGGAPGDTVGVLRALLEARIAGSVLALLCDPEAARRAHRAGEGATVELALGARHGIGGERPVGGRWRIERLGDGRITGTGPFYGGCRMELGPMAVLERDGVRVVLSTRPKQAADRAMLAALGIDPRAQRILALKSSVHFRADFEPLASEVLVVLSPGINVEDPVALRYRRLRPGVRLRPGGPCHRADGA